VANILSIFDVLFNLIILLCLDNYNFDFNLVTIRYCIFLSIDYCVLGLHLNLSSQVSYSSSYVTNMIQLHNFRRYSNNADTC